MSYIDLYMQSELISQGNKEPIIYIFGIPFDSTTSYKPGTRFGPSAIRQAFKNIEYNSLNNGINISNATIKDLGNLKFTVNPQYMLDMARKVSNEVINKGFTGILGGEHLITLGTYMACKNSSLVILDAHYDLRDEYNDTKYSHATFLRRIVEERGSDNILHIGARGFGDDELEFLKSSKIVSINSKRVHENPEVIKDYLTTFNEIYLSIDLDAIDPAFAPGVGTPEPLGLTIKQFFDILAILQERKIKAFDIVELSPPYDNGSTSVLAAKIILEMIASRL
ncbi:MAG: agmatinase [Candidatus Nitrosocaldaceae archaeon]